MLGERPYYTIFMLLAACLAGLLVRGSQRSLPLTTVQRFGILTGALAGAMFGAKLPFVIEQANEGIGVWLSDGKTVLWALVGGYIGVETAKWSLHVTVRTGDTFVVPIAVAIAVGRFGCFLFGCCYGIATDWPWGICFLTAPDGGTLARHPTQLYETAFHSFAAVACMTAMNRKIFVGNLMPIYIISYALYRFVSEFLRPEAVWWGLTFYQWSSIPIVLSLAAVVYRRRHSKS